MTNKKPLINFVIDQELLDEVENFWHEARFPDRAKAIKELMRLGLQKHRETKEVKNDRS